MHLLEDLIDTTMPLQLPLALIPPIDIIFDQFYASPPNQIIITALKSLFSANQQFIYLYGPKDSGKTHLLLATLHYFKSRYKTLYLNSTDLIASPALFDVVAEYDILALDNIAEYQAQDPLLFHLMNHCHHNQIKLLVSSNNIPEAIFSLPDLISRLKSGLLYQLEPAQEEYYPIILAMIAENLGFNLSPQISNYLLTHSERNLTKLILVLKQLHLEALRLKKPISLALTRQFIGTAKKAKII